MSNHVVTLPLPNALYERAREAAALAAVSLEQALTQFIALSLPEIEEELPADMKTALNALPLSGDAELWQVANSMMRDEQQTAFESLVEQSKTLALSNAEQTELGKLMNEAQQLMLCKAEAYRLLARRGHIVFPHFNAISN